VYTERSSRLLNNSQAELCLRLGLSSGRLRRCRVGTVKVGFWHNPAAPADSQWVRLLRYCGPSVISRVNLTWLGGTNNYNNRALLGSLPGALALAASVALSGDPPTHSSPRCAWYNRLADTEAGAHGSSSSMITRMPRLHRSGRVQGPKDHGFSRCPLLYYGIFSFGSTAPPSSRRSIKRWSCMRRLASTARASLQ
jgi:hypothetical protein